MCHRFLKDTDFCLLLSADVTTEPQIVPGTRGRGSINASSWTECRSLELKPVEGSLPVLTACHARPRSVCSENRADTLRGRAVHFDSSINIKLEPSRCKN